MTTLWASVIAGLLLLDVCQVMLKDILRELQHREPEVESVEPCHMVRFEGMFARPECRGRKL